MNGQERYIYISQQEKRKNIRGLHQNNNGTRT